MDRRTILVPVLTSSAAVEVVQSAFWLAHTQPVSLKVVEILPPPGFIRWLFSPVIKMAKRYGNDCLRGVQQKATGQEDFSCEVMQFRAPGLMLGIAETAREAQPYMLVLLPEVCSSLNPSGLSELKRRLSEINDCMLVIIKGGRRWRIEPCRKKELPDFKQVIPIDIGKWVV